MPNTHCLESSRTKNYSPAFEILVRNLYTQTGFFSQNQLIALST